MDDQATRPLWKRLQGSWLEERGSDQGRATHCAQEGSEVLVESLDVALGERDLVIPAVKYEEAPLWSIHGQLMESGMAQNCGRG